MLASVESAYRDLVTSVFSTPIAFKAWFATAAVVLAVVQVTTGARIFGKPTGGPDRAAAREPDSPLVGPPGRPLYAPCRLPLRLHPRLPDHGRAGLRPLAARHVHLRLRCREDLVRPRSGPPALARSARRRDALHRARAALEHIEPLVLHTGRLRLLVRLIGSVNGN